MKSVLPLVVIVEDKRIEQLFDANSSNWDVCSVACFEVERRLKIRDLTKKSCWESWLGPFAGRRNCC